MLRFGCRSQLFDDECAANALIEVMMANIRAKGLDVKVVPRVVTALAASYSTLRYFTLYHISSHFITSHHITSRRVRCRSRIRRASRRTSM